MAANEKLELGGNKDRGAFHETGNSEAKPYNRKDLR